MTALIVVDLPKGILTVPTEGPIGPVVANAARLVAAFRRHGSPITLINVAGVAPGRKETGRPPSTQPTDFTVLLPELRQRPEDHVITKSTWGAFTGPDLDAYLKAGGVTQVVIVGVSTKAGVESTARHAHELEYNVTLPIDAMMDTSIDAHDITVARIFPRLGETGATHEVIALSMQRGHDPLGGARGREGRFRAVPVATDLQFPDLAGGRDDI